MHPIAIGFRILEIHSRLKDIETIVRVRDLYVVLGLYDVNFVVLNGHSLLVALDKAQVTFSNENQRGCVRLVVMRCHVSIQ
jgi:hypothetical protein